MYLVLGDAAHSTTHSADDKGDAMWEKLRTRSRRREDRTQASSMSWYPTSSQLLVPDASNMRMTQDQVISAMNIQLQDHMPQSYCHILFPSFFSLA